MANNQRPLERISHSDGVSDDDLNIAIKLHEEGKPVPESLQPALEAHLKSQGQPQHKENDEDDEKKDKDQVTPEQEPDEEDESEEDEEEDENQPPKPTKDETPPQNDKGKEGDKVTPPKPRGVKTVPLDKLLGEREAWEKEKSELTKKIEDLGKSQETDTAKEFEKKLDEVSDKTGLDKEDLRELVGLSTASLKKELDDLRTSVTSGHEKTEEEKQKEYWDDQYNRFDTEFEAALKEKGADPEMAKYKDQIKELAFTEGYNSKSLWELWTRYVKPNAIKKKKSFDGGDENEGDGSGGVDTTEKDWEAIAKDPSKIAALSIEEKAKFTEYMGNRDRNRPIRRPQ